MMHTTTSSVSVPVVGTPASYQLGSDRHPVTVVAVSKSGHQVVVQDATAKLTSGSIFENAQTYEFAADPEGATHTFTRRADGRYRMAGAKTYGTLHLGQYSAYRDPSF